MPHRSASASSSKAGPTLAAPAVARCLAAWSTTGNIKTLVTSVATDPAFWASNNHRTLVRTPIDATVAMGRALGVNVVDVEATVVAEGLVASTFTPSTLTAQSAFDKIAALRLARSYDFLKYFDLRVFQLAGFSRGRVPAPTGYPDDGEAYVTTAYVDELSRLSLESASAFLRLDAPNRRDVLSASTEAAAQQKLTTLGAAATQTWFTADVLGRGGLVGTTLSRQALVLEVLGDPSKHVLSPTTATPLVATTLVALTLGAEDEVQR